MGEWGWRAGTHRDTVVVEDPVLARHKFEVDKVGTRPKDVVCDHGLDELVLQSQGNGHVKLTERYALQGDQAHCNTNTGSSSRNPKYAFVNSHHQRGTI